MSRQPVFRQKKVKLWSFEDDCVPNGSTGKVAPRGIRIYSWNMTFSDKMKFFFMERSVSFSIFVWEDFIAKDQQKAENNNM